MKNNLDLPSPLCYSKGMRDSSVSRSDREKDWEDSMIGSDIIEPEELGVVPTKYWVGTRKPQVKKVYEPTNRRDWPSEDYDSRFDEDLEDRDV